MEAVHDNFVQNTAPTFGGGRLFTLLFVFDLDRAGRDEL